MDEALWNKILNFNLDIPLVEYGFSTRLAYQNSWPKNFTQKAIKEYKKFMYLAATSDLMVSPSETVDAVWHEHLIFTQSYADFCKVIGKQIQHIPSTHNKEDFNKFAFAKERTKKLYEEAFGEQPKEIWECQDMFEPLALPKLKYKIRSFIIIGILAFFALSVPLYQLLKPVYIHIGNPDFLQGYICVLIAVLIVLEIYNGLYLQKIVADWPPYAFIWKLSPLELVYLKTGRLDDVIHGAVGEFIQEGKIILDGNTLRLNYFGSSTSLEAWTLLDTVKGLEPVSYPALLGQLLEKPVFVVMATCINAFRKYFRKSKAFGKLFYLNFIVVLFMLMLGFERLLTGIIRGKPVGFISISLIVATIVMAAFLWRVATLVCSNTIPQFYKKTIIPSMPDNNSWEWQYFLYGTTILSTAFIPLVNSIGSKVSSSSSCGSSGCGGGGSCGGGCGGCGGG